MTLKVDAVYTGYIGDARQFDIVKDMKKKLLSEGGILIVDPAMADYGKLYPALNNDIVEGMKTIVRQADMILPNLTEAAFLLGEEYKENYTEDEIKEMLLKLADMGPELTVLTGVSYEADKLGAVAYKRSTGEIIEYFTEHVPKHYHGTGDIFSSVVIAAYLNGNSIYDSLKEACEFIVSCIKETMSDPTHWYGVKFEDILNKSRK